jgi:hypothetical protein
MSSISKKKNESKTSNSFVHNDVRKREQAVDAKGSLTKAETSLATKKGIAEKGMSILKSSKFILVQNTDLETKSRKEGARRYGSDDSMGIARKG